MADQSNLENNISDNENNVESKDFEKGRLLLEGRNKVTVRVWMTLLPSTTIMHIQA